MERGKTKRFDKEYKVSAVKMVNEEHTATEVAKGLGISRSLIYSWKKKYAQDGNKAFVGKGHLTELAALRKKLRVTEIERDILKKAVGIFSKEDQNGLDL